MDKGIRTLGLQSHNLARSPTALYPPCPNFFGYQAKLLTMCSKGFEPPTHGLEGRCSIQLSYEHTTVMRTFHNKAGDGNRTHVSSLEGWCSTIELHPHIIGVTGFEPATSWSQTRRSSQAEPHPVFFCRIAVVLPATQELLYGNPRILSTTF